MRRILLSILVSLVLLTAVAAQTIITVPSPPPSGNPIGVGYAFSGGRLFATSSASLQVAQPFSFATWMQGTIPLTSQIGFFETSTGLWFSLFNNEPFDVQTPFQFLTSFSGSPNNCLTRVCTRDSWVLDNKLHHVCVVSTTTSSIMLVDGVVRDQNFAMPVSVPQTSGYIALGQSALPLTFFDARIYPRALRQNDCYQLWWLGIHGVVPSSGPLSTGMVAYWPLNGDTLDYSGNSNNLSNDSTPPTVAVLTPTNGAPVSGNVSMTASASDAIAVQNVKWQVDGFSVSTALTTAPYTFSWSSILVADGTHSITAVACNAGGYCATSTPVTVTTINNHVATAYYISNSGDDANLPCTNISLPCATVNVMGSLALRPGDSVLFQAGYSASITISFVLSGPNSGSAQNYFAGPSSTPAVTVSTYGGGTCNPIGGITSGCATLNMSGSTTVCAYLANLDSVLIQNLRCVGGTSAALGFEAGYCFYVRNNDTVLPHSNVALNNVEALDCSQNIYVANLSGPGLNGATVQNSHSAGSTPTVAVDVGIRFRFNGITNCTASGNLVENIGGKTPLQGAYPGGSGNGILFADGTSGCLSEFNVTRNFGRNTTTCGGPAGNWAFIGTFLTFKFNESYGAGPTSYISGCDWDGYDLDGGVSNTLVAYNYSHNNFGGALTIYQINESGAAWHDNYFAYNISENDASGSQQGAVAISNITNTSTNGSAFFNNTIYSNVDSFSNGYCLGIFANTDIKFLNNICYNSGATGRTILVNVNSATVTNMTLNGNDYFRLGGSINPMFRWNGVTYPSLAAFHTATGQDANSLSVDPKLSTPGGGGTCYSSGIPAGPQPCPAAYVLQSGSPMIGAGLNLNSLYGIIVGTRDYYGNTIPNGVGSGFDIGADGGNP